MGFAWRGSRTATGRCSRRDQRGVSHGATQRARSRRICACRPRRWPADRQVTEWGIEHNDRGERADAFLYCVEVKPEGCDYFIPLAPSWLIGEKSKVVARWHRVPGSDRLQPEIVTGLRMQSEDVEGRSKKRSSEKCHCRRQPRDRSLRPRSFVVGRGAARRRRVCAAGPTKISCPAPGMFSRNGSTASVGSRL